MNIITINHKNSNRINYEGESCKQVGKVMNFYSKENHPIVEWFNEPYVLIENEIHRLSSIVANQKVMNKQKFLVKYGMKENFNLTI